MVKTPDFNLPDPCIDMTPKRESTVLGTEIRRAAGCSCCHRSVANRFLRTCTVGFPHVNMHEGGGGAQTLCAIHHVLHKQAPVYAASSSMQAAGKGEEVGVGVGGWVGEATMLRERHGKRNQSCKRE